MIKGSCLCGKIRYEADGVPLFGVFCHCCDCQKLSGSGHVPVMGVAKSMFRVTGEPKSYGVRGASGKIATRNFCGDCGSLLFGTPEVVPDIVTIYVGSLEDSSMFEPRYVQFTRDRPAWDNFRSSLPEYETTPDRKTGHT